MAGEAARREAARLTASSSQRSKRKRSALQPKEELQTGRQMLMSQLKELGDLRGVLSIRVFGSSLVHAGFWPGREGG